MKTIITIFILITSVYSWEINTHRAIDRTAISKSKNLANFFKSADLNNYTFNSNAMQFEGYGMTYTNYIIKGEGDGGISKWNQTFNKNKAKSTDLIEAGTILEDAMWQDAIFSGNGRFNNHFYEAQNDGHALTYGYGVHVNAVKWITGASSILPAEHQNEYSYPKAMKYIWRSLIERDPNVRRKYQAKMLVSVGHMLHMVNDMNVPAHVRDDAHPFGDPLEMWMRGGFDGSNKSIGFHVIRNNITGSISRNIGTIHPQSSVADFMIAEADFTSKNFVSKDTLNIDRNDYLPNKSTIRYTPYSTEDGLKKRYVLNRDRIKIAIDIDSYVCNNLLIYYPDGKPCGNPTSIKGDYSVFKESGAVLIKRAIANATGFLDYFFRGQISAYADSENLIVKNISDPNLVKDRDTVTFKDTPVPNGVYPSGKVCFMYDTKDGTREDLMFEYDTDRAADSTKVIYGDWTSACVTLAEDIAPGESITIPIKKDRGIFGLKIIVFYIGNIGDEEGFAVCAAKTPNVIRE